MDGRLFTYTIPVDDGAAPNPFFGICTLVICKPAIRRVAKAGDWVAGLGSKNSPSGDLSGRLVYAMRVDEVIPLFQYDKRARTEWPERIPDITHERIERRLGDCIYDYSGGDPDNPHQRRSVHDAGNIDTDLSGNHALISRHFYYFGRRAIELPEQLQGLCHQTRGHRSDANEDLKDLFESWLEESSWKPRVIHGTPDFDIDWASGNSCSGCVERILAAENDAVC